MFIGHNATHVVPGQTADTATTEDVFIRDCHHDTGVNFTTTASSANFQIGNTDLVGRCGISGCVGKRSADVGIEVDNASECLCENNRMEDSLNSGYFATNYNYPLRPANAHVTWRDCHAYRVGAASGSDFNGFLAYAGDTTYPVNVINIEDCSYTCTLATLAGTENIGINMLECNLKELNVSGFTYSSTGWTCSATSNMRPISFMQTDSLRVNMRGISIKLDGTFSGSPSQWNLLMLINGPGNYDIDGVVLDSTLVNNAYLTGVQVQGTGAKDIRMDNVYVVAMSTNRPPLVVTADLGITDYARFDNWNVSATSAGATIAEENAAKVTCSTWTS